MFQGRTGKSQGNWGAEGIQHMNNRLGKENQPSMAINTLERRGLRTSLCMPPSSYGDVAKNINRNDAGAHTSPASNYCNGSERKHWRGGFGEDTKEINYGSKRLRKL